MTHDFRSGDGGGAIYGGKRMSKTSRPLHIAVGVLQTAKDSGGLKGKENLGRGQAGDKSETQERSFQNCKRERTCGRTFWGEGRQVINRKQRKGASRIARERGGADVRPTLASSVFT